MSRPGKQPSARRTESRVHAAAPRFRPASRAVLAFWIGVTVLALLLRVGLILAPLVPSVPTPVFAGMLYPGDHDDFVRWGIQATDRGVLTLYDEPPDRHDMRAWDKAKRRWNVGQRSFDRVCNYPPLSAYLLYTSGLAFRAISSDRLINTPASLGTFTAWSILGDFLVAAGCAALVALFRPGWAPRLTYLLVLLLPPLWWDSVVWAQTDSVLLAPAVWMLYAMLRRRWLVAGLLWGIALGLKPQAILFVPLWGLALVTTRPYWRVLAGGLVAAAALLVIALPFTLHSGWEWLRRSYVENLFSTYSHLTTLKAFNIWYLHLLLADSIDARAVWLGLTRGAWGKLFLLAGLAGGFVYAVRFWQHDRRALLLWTTLSLLLFVMLPTEVHERYLILALPFLGVVAALAWRAWPGLVLLLVVMMAQLSWPMWLRSGRGQWTEMQTSLVQQFSAQTATYPAGEDEKRQALQRVLAAHHERYREVHRATRAREWFFTLSALLGTALTIASLATLHRTDDPHADSRRGVRAPDRRARRSAAGN